MGSNPSKSKHISRAEPNAENTVQSAARSNKTETGVEGPLAGLSVSKTDKTETGVEGPLAGLSVSKTDQTETVVEGALAGLSVSKTDQTETGVEGPLVVVAIDFGTVHSGFAYSFKGYEGDIKSATHGGMLEEDRVPTTVLLNPDQTFHSFGHKAQRNYCDFEETERKDYFYLENFKMALYKKNIISRDIEIQDVTGKSVKAMKVFSMAIENLKNLALNIVFLSIIDLKEGDIQWMITIPAISSDSARQFMREAARDAGIPENRLRFVLEPEAAALYCLRKVLPEDNTLPVGFKYLLADLGGGTSDLCVHEVLDDGKLREVYRATGEIAGGADVDAEFVILMKELVGDMVWNEFQSNHPSAYIDLMNNFQKQKKIFSSSYKITAVKMEYALLHVLDRKKENSLPVKIKESKYADKMEYLPIEARLKIHCNLMELFFNHSLNNIVNLLNKILEECTGDINTLLLVGGYSESPYLRERIQSEFSKMRVVLVDDARLAVLNGAVMMGWKPKNIIQRRSRFTYGIDVCKPFIEGKHPKSLKFIRDGEVKCRGVFRKMIEKGEIVEYGQTFIFKGYRTAREPERKHKEIHTLLFRSTRENPQYCIEEEGCSLVGYIVCKPPPEGWPDYLESDTHLIVGETEFTVKYFNLTTGQEYKAQMDFL